MIKQINIILFLAGILFLINGCTTEKDMSFSVENEFSVSYKTTTASLDTIMIPAQNNTDFENRKYDIQGAALQGVSFTVTSVTSLKSGSTDTIKIDSIGLKVGDIFGKQLAYLTSQKNINLKNSMTAQNLTVNDNGFIGKAFIESAMKNAPYGFKLNFSFTKTPDSLNYKIKFRLDFNLKYNETKP